MLQEPSSLVVSSSNDNKLEDSTGKTLTIRQIGDNESIWTWSGKKVLAKGELNLEMCVRTIYGDLNNDCHNLFWRRICGVFNSIALSLCFDFL